MAAVGLWPRVRQLLPWAGATVLLGYIGWTTSWESAWVALKHADVIPVTLILLGGTLLSFSVDTLGVSITVSRFIGRVTWRQALPVKATSYMLNVLNYNAALVGMAWYFQRIREVSFWRVLGSLFVLNVMDIVALALLLAVGIAVNGGLSGIDPLARATAWGILGGVGVGFPLFVVTLQKGLQIPILTRLAHMQILAPFRDFRWSMLPVLLLPRLALLMSYMAVQFALFPEFGVAIPLRALLVYFPLSTFVQAIPIAPSGLGTIHAFNRWAYHDFVQPGMGDPDGVLDACTTTLIVVALVFRVAVAWAFLGRFSKEVIQQASRANAPVPESKE